MNHDPDGLIQWLCHSHPDTVVEEVIDKLDDGIAIETLWAAGALTAARYVSNQARNLLGFVSHAMIG